MTVAVGITNRIDARYKRIQSIDFGTIANPRVDGTPSRLSAVASSGLPVRFEVVSGPARIEGALLTASATGRIVVRARQDGSEDFAPAFAEQTFEVVADTVVPRPTLTFNVADGLRLSGRPGSSYRVEFTDSFSPNASWKTLEEVKLTQSIEPVRLAPVAAATGTRFYRAVALP